VNIVAHVLGFFIFCLWGGHDWFNGGEACRDCAWPRPAGWAP
jgi:hypothetical protein